MSDVEVKPEKLRVSTGMKSLYSILIFVGFITFVVGFIKYPYRLWPSFLTSFFFFISLGLGGLFFTALQHVTKASWSVTIRRFAESMASFLPLGVASAVFLFFGAKSLYVWLDPAIVENDPILLGKAAYLNGGFFTLRLGLFFLLWLIFYRLIVCRSTKQDETGDDNLTLKNVPTSVAFLILFALTYSLFSIDTLMSLMPHWYSTMFGVYCFSGLFQSSLAVIILITLWVKKQGYLGQAVNENHFHDLGKFLKAFTVFYAYIAFCQFMLIWYANLPEETEFFIHRSHGGWMEISLSLIFFKFIVPFIALLPRWAKRSPTHLASVAVLVIIMQFVDVYWLVYPNFNHGHVVFGWAEVGIFLGFLGVFLFCVTRFLSRHYLIPIKDPRLQESIQHVVTY